MTIKEIESRLNIPRATVRFYERQGLLKPKRDGNSYREYEEEDVVVLKKIIVMRKIGFSLSDIEKFLRNDVDLQELLVQNLSELQEKMKELEGAMRVCEIMQKRRETSESFDEEFYWNEIRAEEEAGNRFIEILNEAVKYERKVILEQFNLLGEEGKLRYGKLESFFCALGICVLIGVGYYLINDRSEWQDLLYGFTFSFLCIVVHSIVGLPFHFFWKKKPEMARRIRKIGDIVAVLLMISVVAVMIWMIAK